MLDENSSLIVEIIGLNNQIKHGKGTAQLGEFTEKLDKKRKQLNKNLMTLAKWADESSDSSPRPPPQAQYAQPSQQMHHPQQQMHPHAHMQQAQQYAPRPGMPMNMGMHPHMAGGQMASQSQMQQAQARYSQAQAHMQAQALANYQARVAAQMGSQASQYMQMNPAMVQQQHQQQQPRYDPVMTGYGNPQQQQQGMVNPMGMAPPQTYGGYQMPNAYAMIPPQQQQQQQQQVPPMHMNMPSPGAPNGQAQLSPGPSAGMQRPGNQ